MPVDPKTLPSDPATLQKIIVDLTAQLDTEQGRLAKVERELATIKRAQKPKASTATRARKASE